MHYDAIVNRSEWLPLTPEQVYKRLEDMFPEKELFYHSEPYWRESEDYILKAKGCVGDVIIGWKEENNK